MDPSRPWRVRDFVPDWLAPICCCCDQCFDDTERPSAYSSALPLHGSSDAYTRVRDEGRREDESLLQKSSDRSDRSSHPAADASTSGASASRHDIDKPKTSKKPSKKHKRVSSVDRSKALEDTRFSAMAVPTYSTAHHHWLAPPGLPDEDVCAICLEEYSDGNPRHELTCHHTFHLCCILEWEERGHDICPLCDVTVASNLGDI